MTNKTKFVIEGTHRNRECYVTDGKKGMDAEIFFCMERNEDSFMGQFAGHSYVVRAVSPKHQSFLADSWKDAVIKLHAIFA
jgi:hypothetical protein